jgi:hypothetical protein
MCKVGVGMCKVGVPRMCKVGVGMCKVGVSILDLCSIKTLPERVELPHFAI